LFKNDKHNAAVNGESNSQSQNHHVRDSKERDGYDRQSSLVFIL